MRQADTGVKTEQTELVSNTSPSPLDKGDSQKQKEDGDLKEKKDVASNSSHLSVATDLPGSYQIPLGDPERALHNLNRSLLYPPPPPPSPGAASGKAKLTLAPKEVVTRPEAELGEQGSCE